ncbi:MAG: phospholipid carrier-dependent glycosyltransferase, partial [Anaerolineae bacterium]
QGHLTEALALDGYDLAPADPRPGGELAVTLYWQPLQALDREYHSFVHLVDAGGQTVAQNDHRPGGVYYPTTLWRPGERLRDLHTLSLPADLPPGDYRLVAGMYAFSADGSLEGLGEPLSLGEVTVGR